MIDTTRRENGFPAPSAWPPSKGELEMLYVSERLSARRIAEIYGMRSSRAVLKLLRRHSVPIRKPPGSIPRVTPGMVTEWARRYETGETLREIAEGSVDPVTVRRHLSSRGIKIRRRSAWRRIARERRNLALFGEKANEIRRLYFEERLSCRQIARRLAREGFTDQQMTQMVHRRLKDLGLAMRFPDRYNRFREFEGLAQEWATRYNSGEPASRIAAGVTSGSVVISHLRRIGVEIRTYSEAMTRYPRFPFSGDALEKAYILGFVRGDVYVHRHGAHLRCSTATTHSAQLDLFTSLFAPFGSVRVKPRLAKVTGYIWDIVGEVDYSFEFLLQKTVTSGILDRAAALSYLAGLFDAEGSLALTGNSSFRPCWTISNSDPSMLDWVVATLVGLGFHPSRVAPDEKGVAGVSLSRRDEVVRLLRTLPLRHPEKKAKARLAIDARMPATEKRRRWHAILEQIRDDRNQMLRVAEWELAKKGMGATNSLQGQFACLRYLYQFKRFPLDRSIWAETLNWLGEYVEEESTKTTP